VPGVGCQGQVADGDNRQGRAGLRFRILWSEATTKQPTRVFEIESRNDDESRGSPRASLTSSYGVGAVREPPLFLPSRSVHFTSPDPTV